MSSQLEAARAEHPADTDAARVVRIADELICEWDLRPPIPLAVVAGVQGIAQVRRVPLDVAACLVPGPGPPEIKLRATDSPGRQNFSGFHEVGHTFMPGYQLQIQFRCDPGHSVHNDRSVGGIEGLCDLAAAELLLPTRFFVADVAAASLDFAAVGDLADAYAASLEATARRLASFAPEPAVLLRLELCNKLREEPGAPPRLRASSFHPATPITPAIPRLKSLDLDDPLQAVLQEGAYSGPSMLAGLTRSSTPFHVEAIDCPWTDGRTGRLRSRVLVLVSKTQRGFPRP